MYDDEISTDFETDFNVDDMSFEDIDIDDIDTEEIDTEEIDTEEIDTEEIDTEEMDTEEMDTEEMDTEEIDTEDIDTEEIDTEEIDTEEIDTEEIDTEDIDTEEMDTANTATTELETVEGLAGDTNTADISGCELLERQMRAITNAVSITQGNVAITQLVNSEFKKQSRTETRIGLAALVEQWGVLTPIHVMRLEDADTYIVLDGLRRVYGAVRNKLTEVPCIIWDFDDKVVGKKMANTLSLMLNRTEQYAVIEQWSMLQVLESVNNATPAMIEYLLGLKAGQAMKLKDIMLCEDDYIEIRQKLIDGGTDIDAAYRKLTNLRKKEMRIEKEDANALVETGEGTENSQKLSTEEADAQLEIGGASAYSSGTAMEVGEPELDNTTEVEETELETEQVQDLLEQADAVTTDEDTTEEVDLSAIDKTDELRQGSIYQKVGQRHPVDKEIRLGTFIRDGFKCRCCGMGGNEAYLAVLAFHHAIPVFAGGPDTKENGLTLCVNCHILLHTYLQGKLALDLQTITDGKEVQKFKRIMQFGNIALEACKKGKISKQRMQEETVADVKHPRPEQYITENTKLFKEAQYGVINADVNTTISAEVDTESEEEPVTIDLPIGLGI